MTFFLIPARAGSKGWPGKNRKLFDITARLVSGLDGIVLVSTDDDNIKQKASQYHFTVIDRPAEYAADTADMIGVLKHTADSANLHDDDIIILLYLTSPGRTADDITNAYRLFRDSGARSLVCRVPAKTNPYMCIYGDGSPVIAHDFYRRQDYPQCYEIRHHVAIYCVSEIAKLNKQLFNSDTVWMDITDPIDVDYEKDFIDYNGGSNDTGRIA
jgi:CMP-N,N'-diacetyllegionaminic acid synthase